ncbi:MAG: oxidoreductase [Solirubrobacteraceae bacterium]|nr:oxidoreductase [Solirubrobacteraceae bacterium]
MTPAHLEEERTLVVTERRELVPGIVAFTLAAADGSELPLWQPGAHIDLIVGDDVVRQYSLCGDPADRSSYRVAVLREDDGRGGSTRIHEELFAGEQVQIRGPRNHFAFEVAPRYRFIAGGIGITAILPMVRTAAARGAEWSLAYGGKSVAGMAFAAELAREFPDRVALFPSASTGRMDVAAQLAAPDPVTDVYCCGPQALMDAVEAAAGTAGWLPGAVRMERFVPRELGAPVWQEPFEVDLLLSGQVVTVTPDTTVLEACRGAGALVLSSCETGTCGTCETPVLEGAIDHRDSVLTADEQAAGDRMMICVSRAAGPRLTLEL